METFLSFGKTKSEKHLFGTKSSSRDPESKPQMCQKRLLQPRWPVWERPRSEAFHRGEKAQRSLGKAKAQPTKSTWTNDPNCFFATFSECCYFHLISKTCRLGMRFVADIWQQFFRRTGTEIGSGQSGHWCCWVLHHQSTWLRAPGPRN